MVIDGREPGTSSEVPLQRRTWQAMELTYVGEIKELVKGGTGKSGGGNDPGDLLKPPGGE